MSLLSLDKQRLLCYFIAFIDISAISTKEATVPKQDPIVSELRQQLRAARTRKERQAISLLLALYPNNIGALCCLITELPKHRVAVAAAKRLMLIAPSDKHLAMIANFLPSQRDVVRRKLSQRLDRKEILKLYVGHAPRLSSKAARELIGLPNVSNGDLRYIIEHCPDREARYDAGDLLLANPGPADIVLIQKELPDFRLEAMHEYLRQCSAHDLYNILEQQNDQAYIQVHGRLVWENPQNNQDVVFIRTMPPPPHFIIPHPVASSLPNLRLQLQSHHPAAQAIGETMLRRTTSEWDCFLVMGIVPELQERAWHKLIQLRPSAAILRRVEHHFPELRPKVNDWKATNQ